MPSNVRTDHLKWDEGADEPYMIIPRFPDLRLTPWREEDVDAIVSLTVLGISHIADAYLMTCRWRCSMRLVWLNGRMDDPYRESSLVIQ